MSEFWNWLSQKTDPLYHWGDFLNPEYLALGGAAIITFLVFMISLQNCRQRSLPALDSGIRAFHSSAWLFPLFYGLIWGIPLWMNMIFLVCTWLSTRLLLSAWLGFRRSQRKRGEASAE